MLQVTKFEFVINLCKAKALGTRIEVPTPLSARAERNHRIKMRFAAVGSVANGTKLRSRMSAELSI